MSDRKPYVLIDPIFIAELRRRMIGHKVVDDRAIVELTASELGILLDSVEGFQQDRGKDGEKRPIPMILHCPECKARHVDEGEFATRSHHTHACQGCGLVWRPALVATVGVRFLPGFKNEPEDQAPISFAGVDPSSAEGKLRAALWEILGGVGAESVEDAARRAVKERATNHDTSREAARVLLAAGSLADALRKGDVVEEEQADLCDRVDAWRASRPRP